MVVNCYQRNTQEVFLVESHIVDLDLGIRSVGSRVIHGYRDLFLVPYVGSTKNTPWCYSSI